MFYLYPGVRPLSTKCLLALVVRNVADSCECSLTEPGKVSRALNEASPAVIP